MFFTKLKLKNSRNSLDLAAAEEESNDIFITNNLKLGNTNNFESIYNIICVIAGSGFIYFLLKEFFNCRLF